ncbi:cotranscriptional regulator FAM172A-like [Actinia tenebrosa]|uniref:Cotranscriptional regulator FAM172A-like n=1 Tax=Actinia tenebrosa TaxID=6105 RepID=A0A6P8ILR1_ACTTE|nr:cotranscriptional regulator FAM172A-like [Actinia tenebrosa]
MATGTFLRLLGTRPVQRLHIRCLQKSVECLSERKDGYGQLFEKRKNKPRHSIIHPWPFKEVNGDRARNQNRYENNTKADKDYLHDVCLPGNLKLLKKAISVDAGKKEPQGFFFMSEEALSFKKLIILMHGGGAVPAGQWAKSVILNENLESGTMVPYIETALKVKYSFLLSFFLSSKITMSF